MRGDDSEFDSEIYGLVKPAARERSMRSFVPVAVHFGELRVCFSGGNPHQNQRACTAVRPIISFRGLDDGAIELEIEAPQIPRDELEGKRNAELVELGCIAALVEGS